MLQRLVIVIACLLCAALAAGCVVYEPYPGYYYSSTYDRAWNAAVGAVQDAGVQVTSADQGSGYIRGIKDGINVTATVLRQADGRTRVQFDTKGPTDRDPGLANSAFLIEMSIGEFLSPISTNYPLVSESKPS